MDAQNEVLLNIFLEEARDLLDALALTIQKWSTDLQDKSIFADLKRDLHTLKGGARMVNQPQLSALAHELESFCALMLEGNIGVNREAYDLICKGQDRMNAIIEALVKKQTVLGTEDMIAELKGKPVAATVPVLSELVSSLPLPQATEENRYAENKAIPKVASEPAGNEIIRVRADLLEKLNNLAIESNIIRVNMGHFVENFSLHITDANKILKVLQEKLKMVPKTAGMQVTSEIQGLIHLCKQLSQVQSNIESLLSQQSRIELDLQNRLVDTRMVPFNSVVPRLSRIARQLAEELNKKIDFQILQSEGEIDRNILEHLVTSLEHLLRNALDHGIESPEKRQLANKPEVGKITLRFYRMGNDACIEIKDDGNGIEPEIIRRKAIKLGFITEEAVLSTEDLIRYILEPGFSTQETVSQISGRGVGMDVVNTVVKGLGGNLAIESIPGQSTTFTIRLPFTTSVNRALLVKVQGQIFGILLSNIESIVLFDIKQIKENLAKSAAVIIHEGKEYQFKYLGDSLGLESKPNLEIAKEGLPVLLFNFADYNVALLVDGLAGSQEIVVQTLGPQFKLMDIFSGATLLADGRVVMVLDACSITTRAIKKLNETPEVRSLETKHPVVLVVDDSVTIRTVTKNFLERHKYTIHTARDGMDAFEKIEKQIPDIILLDVEMPRMDGFQFAEKIRSISKFSKIPIIMITFCAGEEQRAHAHRIGIQRFLSKPYQESELLETIENLLEKR